MIKRNYLNGEIPAEITVSGDPFDILLELFLKLTEKDKKILWKRIENARYIRCSDRYGKIKLEYCDINYVLHTLLIPHS